MMNYNCYPWKHIQFGIYAHGKGFSFLPWSEQEGLHALHHVLLQWETHHSQVLVYSGFINYDMN